MKQINKNTYNDGCCQLCVEIGQYSEFNAKRNAKKKDNFEVVLESFYSEESRRQQDFLFASSLGKKLTLKIKIPYFPEIEDNYKIIIDNYLYDIITFDIKNREDIYLYLEGVRELG